MSAVLLGSTLTSFAAAPPGWQIAGSAPKDYEFSTEAPKSPGDRGSATIASKPGSPEGFATLMQTILAEDYRGSRCRLSGYLKSADAKRAQMWMRVDSADGHVLAFDNMDSRPITGTTGWTRYEIVLDVPPESARIAFGFLLAQAGKVWASDFSLEKVDAATPTTAQQPILPRKPQNMNFAQ